MEHEYPPFTIIRDPNEIDGQIHESHVRAIRWDVVPWALVLDLDLVEFQRNSQVRGWLVFAFADDITILTEDARAGLGFHLYEGMTVTKSAPSPNGKPRFKYELDACTEENQRVEFIVDASDMILVHGHELADNGYNMVEVRQRTRQMSDELLQDAVRSVDPGLFEPPVRISGSATP